MAENESSRDLKSYKKLMQDDEMIQGRLDTGIAGTPQSTLDFDATEPGRRKRQEVQRPAGRDDALPSRTDAEPE
jgi:hypothetical protein